MSVQLGPFEIDHPFILAPMAGITNSPFRRLMRRRGSSLVISELVSANGMAYADQQNNQKTLDLLHFHEDERKVGLQVFGEDEHRLALASRIVEERGADFVDLNLGCPVPKVVKKGAGSALCRDPEKLGRVLEAMVQAVEIPVSIKIRTGWDQHSRNAIEIVEVARDAGVAWVAIHGRTRSQGYSGEADWEFIGNVKAKTGFPIIGNGDLTTPERALKRLNDYDLDAVMIGRGALRNPFIFEQAHALWCGEEYELPGVDDYFSIFDSLRVYLKGGLRERTAFLNAKKLLAWYSAGFPGCHEFRKQVFQTKEEKALWDLAYSFFDQGIEKRDTAFLREPFLMGGHG